MKSKLHLLLFLTIVIKCKGHLGVHDTAGSTLGGFAGGFHIGGYEGIPHDHGHRPHHHGHRPPYHNNGQEMHQHYGNKPYGHGFNMGMGMGSNYNNNGYYPNYRPNYQTGNDYEHNNYMPGNTYGNNIHGYNWNLGPLDNNFHNNNQGCNSHYHNNHRLPNQGDNYNANGDKDVIKNSNYVMPKEYSSTTVSTTTVSTTQFPTEATTKITTKKPDNDEALFLPLDTTGDKIYTTTSKSKLEQKDDDEVFQIDERMNTK